MRFGVRLAFRFAKRNKELIREVMELNLKPDFISVVDESERHYEADDSHFKLSVVSDKFQGLGTLQRHKIVMKILKDNDIMNKIHAVSVETKTVDEMQKQK